MSRAGMTSVCNWPCFLILPERITECHSLENISHGLRENGGAKEAVFLVPLLMLHMVAHGWAYGFSQLLVNTLILAQQLE